MNTLIKASTNLLAEPLAGVVPLTTTEPVTRTQTVAQDRRVLLRTAPNPDPGSDYVVRLEMETTPSFALGPLKIVTRYVPDKLLLKPSCLDDYLHALTQPEWPTLESAALAMRDDLGNEVVPRWIAILVSPSEADLEAARHSVLIEDRQPQWDNPNLLARLQECR